MKEPKILEEISKKILLKNIKSNINLETANQYYTRAKKQTSFQKSKIFIFRDYGYSKFLFQKSIDLSLNAILKTKEKEKREREFFFQRFDETKYLNSQITEIFDKMPLGSDFFKDLLYSTLYLKEAENYYNIKKYETAHKKLDMAYKKTEKLFSSIMDSIKNFYSSEKIKEWKHLYNEALYSSFNSIIIVIIKDERTLKLLKNGKILKTYSVEFGKNPLEKKTKSGDLATPEGRYQIVQKKGRNQTKYYLALLLNYPNEDDRRRFEERKRKGLISKNAKIGGLVEIHGDGGLGIDWTEGCVAISNEDMKELFYQVSNGTPVYIIGSLGNKNVLSNFENHKRWKNSKKS